MKYEPSEFKMSNKFEFNSNQPRLKPEKFEFNMLYIMLSLVPPRLPLRIPICKTEKEENKITLFQS